MPGFLASQNVHAAAWILVYGLAVAASVLTAALARGAADAPLRRLAASEAYAVAVISLTYIGSALGLADALPALPARLAPALINGALLHALALIAATLPPFAASLSGASPAAPPLRARLAAGALGLSFTAIWFVGEERTGLRLYVLLAGAPLVLVAAALLVAVAASARRLLAPASDEGAMARRVVALAGSAAYLAFVAGELAPQLLSARSAAGVPTYYALAAFFAILNGGMVAMLVPRAAARDSAAREGAARKGDAPDGSPVAGLSGRETEVARLLAEGASYREIGERLFVSVSTVQTHVTRIYAKLGVRNKVELANALRESSPPVV